MNEICHAVLTHLEPFTGSIRSFDDFLAAFPSYEKDDVIDAVLELVRAKMFDLDEEKALVSLTEKGLSYLEKQ